MANKGNSGEKGNTTYHFNEVKTIFPRSMDELHNKLCQKLQAKLDAYIKAFSESCTKNRHDTITQFCEPAFGEPTPSISSKSEIKGH